MACDTPFLRVLEHTNMCERVTRGSTLVLALVSPCVRKAVLDNAGADVHLVSRRAAPVEDYTQGLASIGCARVLSMRLCLAFESVQDARTLLEAVARCTHLQYLDVSECQLVSEDDEARQHFRAAVVRMIGEQRLPALQRLRLWQTEDTRSGIELAAAAAVAAQTPTLQALEMGRGMMPLALQKDLTQHVLERLGSLRSLEVARCQFDRGVLALVVELLRRCRLQRLALSIAYTKASMRVVGEPDIVAENTTLRELRLVSCDIDTGPQARQLARVLCAVPKLEVCNLEHNFFGAKDGTSVLSALAKCTSLRDLNLRHCDIDETCVGALVDTLDSLPKLHTFKMHEWLRQNDERRMLAALCAVPKLRNLHFKSYYCSHAPFWGPQPLPSTLEVLNLKHHHLPWGCFATFERVLTGASNLRELLLDGSELGAQGGCALARIVGECSRLKVLSVATCKLGDVGIRNLATAGGALRGICTLDVRENAVTAAGGGALGALVSHCHALQVLRVGCNALGAEGVRAFAGSAVVLTSCTTLDVERNKLGPKGICALSPLLRRCPKLRVLNLEANGVNCEALTELARQPVCRSVHELYLGWNDCFMSDDGSEPLLGGLAALLDAVRESPLLHTLSLCRTQLGAAGVELLLAALPHLPGVQQVDTTGNSLTARLSAMPAVRDGCLRWNLSLD